MKTLEDQIAKAKSYNLAPEHEAKMIAMITKKYNKGSKASDKRWARRDAAKNAKPVAKWEGLTMAEINRMNAEENLPSSMK